jgi:FdhD protein
MKSGVISTNTIDCESGLASVEFPGNLEDIIFEDYEIQKIVRDGSEFSLEATNRPIIDEISLKLFVNNLEVASLLCINQQQVELALGFLYNEGVINSYADVSKVSYNPALLAVFVTLQKNITVKRQASLRSVTAGCGKCYTYINPQKRSQFRAIESYAHFSLSDLIAQMQTFTDSSRIYRSMGGVHSLLFKSKDEEFFSEDIGRHNCFDKIVGILLMKDKLDLAKWGVVFISGRVTSEIMTKAIRLGVPVVVSKSTPSVTAIKLANEYQITLLGYVVNNQGYVYSGSKRLYVNDSASCLRGAHHSLKTQGS